MAGNIGRSGTIEKNSSVIAGVRDWSLAWGGSSVNITSGEDNGVRLLLPQSGEEQLDISAEGIMKENQFLTIALTPGTSKMMTDIQINLALIEDGNTTAATITGDFRMSAKELSNPYQDAVTFSMTLESSGPWVYTAESA